MAKNKKREYSGNKLRTSYQRAREIHPRRPCAFFKRYYCTWVLKCYIGKEHSQPSLNRCRHKPIHLKRDYINR